MQETLNNGFNPQIGLRSLPTPGVVTSTLHCNRFNPQIGLRSLPTQLFRNGNSGNALFQSPNRA